MRTIERKCHSLIQGTIEQQLQFDPDLETRNRKPLREPLVFEATWEIWLGPANRFRIFYAVDRERLEVAVLAIGEKRGNRLYIEGEEM